MCKGKLKVGKNRMHRGVNINSFAFRESGEMNYILKFYVIFKSDMYLIT